MIWKVEDSWRIRTNVYVAIIFNLFFFLSFMPYFVTLLSFNILVISSRRCIWHHHILIQTYYIDDVTRPKFRLQIYWIE